MEVFLANHQPMNGVEKYWRSLCGINLKTKSFSNTKMVMILLKLQAIEHALSTSITFRIDSKNESANMPVYLIDSIYELNVLHQLMFFNWNHSCVLLSLIIPESRRNLTVKE